jgi:hypothetical protein
MVARDPTADEVRGFLEFAGLSELDAPLAIRALKVLSPLPGDVCGTSVQGICVEWAWSGTDRECHV